MGKHATLTEIDSVYDITVMQYSNKGIIFVLKDKIIGEEVDRFLWEYPYGAYCKKGNLRRFT